MFFQVIPWTAIYVSLVKKGEDGKYQIVPLAETPVPAPTGSILLDAVGKVLATTRALTAKAVAEKMGVDRRKLSGAMQLITNLNLDELVEQYRSRQMKELIVSTDASVEEMSNRMGYTSQTSFCHICSKRFNRSVRDMRV